MPFAYYARLSPKRQAIYRKSDAIATLALPAGVDGGADLVALKAALAADDRAGVQAAGQRLIDALVRGFGVPPVRVRALAVRPADETGELHGLYEPEDGPTVARITVWMRTAVHGKPVAFRSLTRTLIHELCHHLDYELFLLAETFHTEGFYKRESSLANALFVQAGEPGRPLV
jgi:hypothetical protein